MSESPGHPASLMFTSRSAVKWLTILCLTGLAAGVLAGVLAARWEVPGTTGAVAIADALVRAWTNAFRLLVAPLVMAQLYLAVAGEPGTGPVKAGRMGAMIPLVFGGLLALTALLCLLLTPAFLTLPWFADVSLPGALAHEVSAPARAASGSAWVDGFIPPNLFAVATTDNILPLMLFMLAFAYAMRRADDPSRETLHRLARGVAQASFTLVGWLLLMTPVVMLALGFRAAVSSGVAVGEVVLGFAVLEIGVLLFALLMLYLVAAFVGGVPLGRFARALWPAQLTAIATRSSLATLPALLGSATTTLSLRAETAAAVLPVAGATLKLSRAVSGPVKLLFLAHVLGISITPERLLVFAVTIILLSASTVGVPSVTSGNRSLPAYVAAGVPAEYVVLLGVATSLTDIFLTVLNSSGYLTAAVLVDRFGARGARLVDAGVGDPVPDGGGGQV